mgnify:CR=1 FL=1
MRNLLTIFKDHLDKTGSKKGREENFLGLGSQIKEIEEQVEIIKNNDILSRYFKNASYDREIAQRTLPDGAEGWFAIPRWEKIHADYESAVKIIILSIGYMKLTKDFWDHISTIGPLRQRSRKVKAFHKIKQQEENDILVVPCQFSSRQGLSIVEFELGIFDILAILLTHLEREEKNNFLQAFACAGDNFVSIDKKSTEKIPLLYSFRNNTIRLNSVSLGWNWNNQKIKVPTGFLI